LPIRIQAPTRMTHVVQNSMSNIDKVRQLFRAGILEGATNADILRKTGIKPHQQVFNITKKLEDEGLITSKRLGSGKVFYLTRSSGILRANRSEPSSLNSEGARSRYPTEGGPTLQGNNGLDLLGNLGFKRAGQWQLGSAGLDFNLTCFGDSQSVLYAFVIEGRVMYIGITNRSLCARMNNYKRPGPSQSTNLGNKGRIEECLKTGAEVGIFVFVPPAKIYYKNIAINLAAGLEGPLISLFRPPWNRMKTSATGL